MPTDGPVTPDSAARGGALSNLRVLDLSRVLAGPWCSQMLADFGAEVIKIERPGRGDDTRAWGPPWLADTTGADTGESAYYLAANRGKKSVTLDLGRDRGQQIARSLAARSDVLIENFKPGHLDRWGLGYDALHELHPGLVYCSISGFGQTGPDRNRPGYDFMVQAMGGLMSVTGEPDDVPGGGPVKTGVALADILTGLYACSGILAALNERERSGLGQHIDLALLDVQVACLANQAMNYLVTGEPPGRLGNAHPNIVPYQSFPTSDGHIVVAVGNDAQFAELCAVLGCPELADDDRFATNAGRVGHRHLLIPTLAERLVRRGSGEWLTRLEAAGVPCGPINSLDQVFALPQVKARGMQFELPHSVAGRVPQVRSPLRFSDSPDVAQRPPPTLGQDTDEVLREVLGLDRAERQSLRDDGIV